MRIGQPSSSQRASDKGAQGIALFGDSELQAMQVATPFESQVVFSKQQ